MSRVKIFIFAFIFIVGCAGTQISDTSLKSYDDSITDLNKIEKDKNLTNEQKIIIKYAKSKLQDAKTQNKKVEKLQEQVIKKSENAGAGKMVKYILGVIVFLVGSFIAMKILKRFGI